MEPESNEDNPKPTLKYLSINQAAELANVSRRTIYNWIQSGKLPYKRLISGAIRIDPSSIWQDKE